MKLSFEDLDRVETLEDRFKATKHTQTSKMRNQRLKETLLRLKRVIGSMSEPEKDRLMKTVETVEDIDHFLTMRELILKRDEEYKRALERSRTLNK